MTRGVSDDDIDDAAERFTTAVTALTETELRELSRLPGWTRAHVVAHVVLNAEGFCCAAGAVRSGQPGLMYPDGVDARDRAISTLAASPREDLLVRLRAANSVFVDAWRSPIAGRCATATGTPTFDAATVPSRRLRELQVHLVDLGVEGVTELSWTEAFVEHDLPLQWPTVALRTTGAVAVIDELDRVWRSNGAAHEPARTDRRTLLAWLLDRARPNGLPGLSEWGNRSRWEHLAPEAPVGLNDRG